MTDDMASNPAREVVMPRLGWGGETGRLVEWLKRDGDTVRVGDIICVVEGEKANVDVETLDAGVLRIPPDSPALGADVPVGTPLAYIVAPDAVAPRPDAASAPGSFSSLPAGAAAAGPGEASLAAEDTGPSPARAARLAQPRISPLARRLAREQAVVWTALTGSGESGRIVARDIRQAAERTAAPAAPRRVPLTKVQRATASRMRQSAATAAPVTLTTEADASALVRLREQLTADVAGTERPAPSINDLFIRLTALALRDHPAMYATLDGDDLLYHEAVHIGLAVETKSGLLVPVIRDAETKSIARIAEESAALIASARQGTLRETTLTGGRFTITNLGALGIDAFTPIINPPECAILGIGRIAARPIVVDEATEQVAVRKVVTLSLTFDHRQVDGAPAARFLQQVVRYVSRPTLWLVR